METTPSGAYVRRSLRPLALRDVEQRAERLGTYELLHRVGSGGMGEVFLAAGVESGGRRQPVALKRLLPELADDAAMRARFADEARLLTRVKGPHLVNAVDVSRAHRDAYFAMDFVDGAPLSAVLRAAARAGRAMAPEAALQIVSALADALHAVHELRGSDGRALDVVHCDVSPTNVLVTRDGDVCLIDFGIARGRHASAPALHRGNVLGTLAYMSPEQCRAEQVDRRSDVFSLGVILWELTTFSRLFRSLHDDELAARVARADVPKPTAVRSDYPRDLEEITLRALDHDPERRFPTAARFRETLDRYASRHDLAPSPTLLSVWMRGLRP